MAGEVAQLRRHVAAEAGRTPWSKPGHQRQHEVLQKIRGVFVVNLAKALEATFGSRADIPLDILAVVAADEKSIATREPDPRMADSASWLAVEKFSSDPLCANESKEKRWRKAKKEADDETMKKKEAVAAWWRRGNVLGGQGVYEAEGGGRWGAIGGARCVRGCGARGKGQ